MYYSLGVWSVETDDDYTTFVPMDLQCACLYPLFAYDHRVDLFCHYFMFSEDPKVTALHIAWIGLETPICF